MSVEEKPLVLGAAGPKTDSLREGAAVASDEAQAAAAAPEVAARSAGQAASSRAAPGNRGSWPSKGPVRAVHPQKWDRRHGLDLDPKNEPHPENPRMHPSLRRGFSQPHSMPDLEKYLAESRSMNTRSLLLSLRSPEPRRPTSNISTDAIDGVNARAPMIPERHVMGGTMVDRDKTQRPWNDRFTSCGSATNEYMHRSQRSVFGMHSTFEALPSQKWRRYLEQEICPGTWYSYETRRPPRFPPTGI